MGDDELTDAEIAAFADWMEAFVRRLSSREEAFLRRILRSLPRQEDAAPLPSSTVHDLVSLIDQTRPSIDDTVSRNPQPIPPGFRLSRVDRKHSS